MVREMHRMVRLSKFDMTFYYVYVLRSLKKKDWVYVGFSTDLKRRCAKHNEGGVLSTAKYRPLELIHYEAYRCKGDALRRERYLKTSKGKSTLRSMLRDFLESN